MEFPTLQHPYEHPAQKSIQLVSAPISVGNFIVGEGGRVASFILDEQISPRDNVYFICPSNIRNDWTIIETGIEMDTELCMGGIQ